MNSLPRLGCCFLPTRPRERFTHGKCPPVTGRKSDIEAHREGRARKGKRGFRLAAFVLLFVDRLEGCFFFRVGLLRGVVNCLVEVSGGMSHLMWARRRTIFHLVP